MPAVSLPNFVEVETDSFCNRTCQWCPNSWSRRGRQHKYISNQVWFAILDDLCKVRYQGWFAFHNYNEPLADPLIFQRISQARNRLNDAKLTIYTNGDYLTIETLNKLMLMQVDELRVTLYPRKKDTFNEPTKEKILSFLNKLRISTAHINILNNIRRLETHINVETTALHIIVPRIRSYTHRGGSVPLNPLALKEPRVNPCFLPFLSAAIDYHGNLKLCCQIYDTTQPENRTYIIGNVAECGFLNLWFSEKMNVYRQKVATANFVGLNACRYCSHNLSECQEYFLS